MYANNQETEAIYNNRKLTSKISIKMPIIYGIGPEEPGDRGAFALSDFGRSVNPIPTWGGGKLCPSHYY